MVWIYSALTSILNSISSIWNRLGGIAGEIAGAVNIAVGKANISIHRAAEALYVEITAWVASLYVTAAAVYTLIRGELNIAIGKINISIHRAAEDLYVLIRDWVVGIYITAAAAYILIRDEINITIGKINISIHRAAEDLFVLIRDWAVGVFVLLDDLKKSDLWMTFEALSKILDSIQLFFNNPLRAIRDLLVGWLVTWFCRAAAHEIDAGIPLFDNTVPGGGYGGGELPEGTSPDISGDLAWPLDSLVRSGYSFNRPPGHVGIDLALPAGARVYAMHDGIASVPPEMPSGYGLYIVISGLPWRTLYGHGASYNVQDGQRVKRGQQIMIGDTTGRSTGNHMHLEIIYNGQYIDPYQVLPIAGGVYIG